MPRWPASPSGRRQAPCHRGGLEGAGQSLGEQELQVGDWNDLRGHQGAESPLAIL
uniref:Uncharacterized protein n=1 Tax=Setaria viridis TaxID=4556 RepID=A0A4U6TRP3_SETVI|nr:hypothetical protein SEVIR_7G167103v2 [Setaria viridis]